MAKWTNDEAKSKAISSRHDFLSITAISIAVTFIFLGGIKGCTDYNIERLKTPVEIQDINTYQRGANK